MEWKNDGRLKSLRIFQSYNMPFESEWATSVGKLGFESPRSSVQNP